MPHTKGPWRCKRRTHAEYVTIETEAGDSVGSTYKDRQEENAARIVSCVNACEGVSNENLQPGCVHEVTTQRDELLTACKAAEAHFGHLLDIGSLTREEVPVVRLLRDTLEKATGRRS